MCRQLFVHLAICNQIVKNSNLSITYPSRATHIQPELHASDRFYPALIEHMWKLENTYCLPRVISQSSYIFSIRSLLEIFHFSQYHCSNALRASTNETSSPIQRLHISLLCRLDTGFNVLSNMIFYQKKKQLNTYTATVNSTLVGKECCGKVWSKTHAWKLANTVVHFVSR